jgi:hypothetical protein
MKTAYTITRFVIFALFLVVYIPIALFCVVYDALIIGGNYDK